MKTKRGDVAGLIRLWLQETELKTFTTLDIATGTGLGRKQVFTCVGRMLRSTGELRTVKRGRGRTPSTLAVGKLQPIYPETTFSPPKPKLEAMELDLMQIGRSILKVIEDQAVTIGRLKDELKECKSDNKDIVETNCRLAEDLKKAQIRINELNSQLSGGKTVTLADLHRYREGLPEHKG